MLLRNSLESVHLHFSGLPIDFRVVVLEPGVTEDHVLLSEAGDSEERSFGVGFVAEDYVYNFGDLACLVGGTVHVVHRYGAREVFGPLCSTSILEEGEGPEDFFLIAGELLWGQA